MPRRLVLSPVCLVALAALLSAGCASTESRGALRPGTDVSAVVHTVKSQMLESVPRVSVTVEFSNHSSQTRIVDSFRIGWPSGERTVIDAAVRIRPSQSASRTVEIVTSDALSLETVRVDELEERDVSLADKLRMLW